MADEELRDLPADDENGPLAHAEPGVWYGPPRADGTMPALFRAPVPRWATGPPDVGAQAQ